MCLGSGCHPAPWTRYTPSASALKERTATSSTNWRCASRPGEPRTHSTSTIAEVRTRSGRKWISRNPSSCTGAVDLLSFFDYSKNHAAPRSGSTDRSAEEVFSARSIGQDRIRPNAISARGAGMDGVEDPRRTDLAPDTELANYACADFEIRPRESVPGRIGKHNGSLKSGELGYCLNGC
jgi:hypothetical protein